MVKLATIADALLLGVYSGPPESVMTKDACIRRRDRLWGLGNCIGPLDGQAGGRGGGLGL